MDKNVQVQFVEHTNSRSDSEPAHHLLAIYLRLFPGGVLPYTGYIGMCGPKGYGFSAVLVINWILVLAISPPFWS